MRLLDSCRAHAPPALEVCFPLPEARAFSALSCWGCSAPSLSCPAGCWGFSWLPAVLLPLSVVQFTWTQLCCSLQGL